MKRILFLFLLLPAITHAQYITTICGDDTASYTGDGGPAKNGKLNKPEGICHDKSGNIYIADAGNGRVRKIDASTGIITTIAGKDADTSLGGFSGDGGPATNARIWCAQDVAIDTSGNIYIVDGCSHRIRKVAASTGIITTVVGSGAIGCINGSYTGDGGQATDATLNEPVSVCVDIFNNLYIADYSNNVVRKVDASTGIITTVIGKSAGIFGALYVALDSLRNVYVGDQWNHLLLKLTVSTGTVSVIAGRRGVPGYSGDGGPAVDALLNQPGGMFFDHYQNMYFADYGNGAVRRIDAVTGIITTVAGHGSAGLGDGGLAINAQLSPSALFIDKCGTMYIADYDDNRVRMISDAGIISGPYTSICNNTFFLKDTITNGNWSSSNTSVATIDNLYGAIHTLAAGITMITYTTDSNAYGCLNSTTFPLYVGPAFTISGTVSPATCNGINNGNIAANIRGGTGPFQYAWSDSVSLPAINDLAPGLYVVHITDSATQCEGVDSFTVNQKDSLLVISNITPEDCKESNGGISVTVTGGTTPYNYLWSNKATTDNISGLKAGSYSLAVKDVNNCSSNGCFVVEDTCISIVVHDVITPNGDGINDTWTIEGLQDYPKNTVQIFDKWGTLLYEKANYNNDWEGHGSKGELLPDGTYFYVVKLNASNTTGGKNVFTGAVLIKR